MSGLRDCEKKLHGKSTAFRSCGKRTNRPRFDLAHCSGGHSELQSSSPAAYKRITMEGKVVRVRRKRRVRSFRDTDSVSLFRHHLTPGRLGIYAAAVALLVVVGVIFSTYGARVYRSW